VVSTTGKQMGSVKPKSISSTPIEQNPFNDLNSNILDKFIEAEDT